MEGKTFESIDEYIAQYPPDIQEKLEKLRKVIKETAPEAEETISYRMPAFKLNGRPLVYFAPFSDHIGFFPTASGVEAFKDELTGYKTSKGTIQFPLDKPMPLDLVRRIVRFKVAEISKKPAGKPKKK
ncbi:MAG: DUF1801 domain-containing protein [Methanocella sp.]